MRRFLALAALTLGTSGVLANDTMVELKTGGLEYVRTDAVRMAREDLFVSMDEIRVDYAFHNTTDADVESLVAFPMPPVVPSAYEPTGVPVEDVNFLGFRVYVEGQEIFPELSQRALVFGVDVTEALLDARMSLLPVSEATNDALMHLPEPILNDWISRGIVTAEYWDIGQGEELHPYPAWTLEQSYYWNMVFPAGADVRVSHVYTPSVGGTAGVAFLDWEGKRSDWYDDYVKKYCVDQSFENAVRKRLRPEGGIAMFENWISYILTTGRNWYGEIGRFHLTIDKGSTDNLVSFCGTGVKKTGPTTFEVTYENYYPEKDLEVLILQPANW